MKKIFVTVAEFLENGGDLRVGREIFNDYNQPCGTYARQSLTNDSGFIIAGEVSDYMGSLTENYVQIDCTPIYK